MGAIQQLIASIGSPTSSPWTNITNWTPSGNNAGWQGYTLRSVISGSIIVAGTKLRYTFTAASSGDPVRIDEAYTQIGDPSGDPYDFATTPTPVLFSGSASVVVPTGTTVVSDVIDLTVNNTRDLIIAVAFSASLPSDVSSGSGSSIGTYYKSGSDAPTVDASGYSFFSGSLLITRVEVSP